MQERRRPGQMRRAGGGIVAVGQEKHAVLHDPDLSVGTRPFQMVGQDGQAARMPPTKSSTSLPRLLDCCVNCSAAARTWDAPAPV